MWTVSEYKGRDNPVYVNHFAPLIERSVIEKKDEVPAQMISTSRSHSPSYGNDGDDDCMDCNVEATGGVTLLNGEFLSNAELHNILSNKNLQVHDEIPRGLKNDVYFVVRNDVNNQRNMTSKRSVFWDDCGAWTGWSSKKTYHLPENMYQIYNIAQSPLL